ncbi:MAG: class I SAM-dependent methyltransferase [Spirochaetales bacterium]|nr:class I SAM-dependent methyltransferase [Spirochaetales bacterium]
MKATHAKTFNRIAPLYDNARPGYPTQIYDVIDIYSEISGTSKILEVGCGSGIATQEIFEKWQPSIVAIDPGLQLLEVARGKSKNNRKIEYLNCPFDEFKTPEQFDAIFSATAFHWLDKRTKYKRSHELLKDKGKLILFWNNYVIQEESVNAQIQGIYEKHHPDGSLKDARLHYRNKIRNRKNEMNYTPYFDLAVHHEYSYSIKMSAIQYVLLLQSFSNNSFYEEERLKEFYENVENYVKSTGDEIKITVVVNLEIGQKRELYSNTTDTSLFPPA